MRKIFKGKTYLLFILPAILFVLTFALYPALYGVYLSLTNLHFGYPTSRFIGFDNYIRLFQWQPFWPILRNTAVFVSTVVVLQITLGLLIALLLNRRIFGNRLMRGIAILPWIIPGVIIGLTFQQLFTGSRLGIMNSLLVMLGGESRSWLTNPTEAMIIMIIALVWRGTPLSIILQLSGLQSIPKELYEAARIDGATSRQSLWHITLPLLRPILMINVILVTAGTLNHIDIPLSLTNGGPGRATEVLSVALYKQAFEFLDASFAATIATFMLGINLVLTVLYLILLRRRGGAIYD